MVSGDLQNFAHQRENARADRHAHAVKNQQRQADHPTERPLPGPIIHRHADDLRFQLT